MVWQTPTLEDVAHGVIACMAVRAGGSSFSQASPSPKISGSVDR